MDESEISPEGNGIRMLTVCLACFCVCVSMTMWLCRCVSADLFIRNISSKCLRQRGAEEQRGNTGNVSRILGPVLLFAGMFLFPIPTG